MKSEFDTNEPVMIHIENPTTVSCFTAVNGDQARNTYIQAQASIPRFNFGSFMTEKNLILHCNQVLYKTSIETSFYR